MNLPCYTSVGAYMHHEISTSVHLSPFKWKKGNAHMLSTFSYEFWYKGSLLIDDSQTPPLPAPSLRPLLSKYVKCLEALWKLPWKLM